MTARKKFEHISSRPLPYTTKTGIQIGRFYEPPLQQLTAEGEFMQAVLLKDRFAAFPHFRAIGWALYMVGMISVITTLAVVFSK